MVKRPDLLQSVWEETNQLGVRTWERREIQTAFTEREENYWERWRKTRTDQNQESEK